MMNNNRLTACDNRAVRFQIGKFPLYDGLALSPLAGITDLPFRQLCRKFGAEWVVSEMISGQPSLHGTYKTVHRLSHVGERSPIVVQIVGREPKKMQAAALNYQAAGADVIDINLGCPAKKVCHSYAGSALMRDPALVKAILQEVIAAVKVPVTIKTRLGFDEEHINVIEIAKIAQQTGVAAMAIHGRTRQQMFTGKARYAPIKEVVQEVDIPIWVNGDVDSAQKAITALEESGAAGVMIGRAAQGRPWIFTEIKEFFRSGRQLVLPFELISRTIKAHIAEIHLFYGQGYGHRIARKHIIYYFNLLRAEKHVLTEILSIQGEQAQREAINNILHQSWAQDYYYKYYDNKQER